MVNLQHQWNVRPTTTPSSESFNLISGDVNLVTKIFYALNNIEKKIGT